MRSTIIFLFGLLFISQALSQGIPQSLFVELDKSQFGKLMYNFVQTNQNVGSQVTSIQNLLVEIKNSLLLQKGDAQSDLDATKKECDSSIKAYTQKIANYKSAIQIAKERKATLEKNLASDQSSLKTVQTTLASDRAQLLSETTKNTEESTKYTNKNKDILEAIQACKDAVTLLNQIKTSNSSLIQRSSFLQVNENIAKVKQIFESNSHLSKQSSYGTIIEALTQLSTKADAADILQIVTLIQKLQKALEDELAQLKADETTRVTLYLKIKQTLETSIKNNAAQEKTLSSNIALTKEEINKEESTISSNTSLLVTSEEQLKLKQKNCSENIDNLTKQIAEIVDEIVIVDKLITHFKGQQTKTYEFVKQQ